MLNGKQTDKANINMVSYKSPAHEAHESSLLLTIFIARSGYERLESNYTLSRGFNFQYERSETKRGCSK